MKVVVDPCDLKGMIALMDRANEFDSMLFGTNEDGECTTISVLPDKITVITYQDNSWERTNIYYRDGSSEELFHKERRN